MYQEPETRRRSLGALFVIITVALMLYLAFAALHGEHGLIRLLQIEAQEARLREELSGLRAAREVIAAKTARLSSDRPDLDLLDERARQMLGLGRPDELLVR